VTSRATDIERRRERGRLADQAIAADRRERERSRLADRADEQLPDHRDRLSRTDNTPGDEPL
jgi:hypothetical protein